MTNNKKRASARSPARRRSDPAAIARYEAEKAIWTSSNPNSTPEQYADALRRIAKACGL